MAQESSDLNRGEFQSLTNGEVDDRLATRPTDVDSGSGETEHLKAQIAETRSQMGETIDELQERLSFTNISEQVSEHVSNVIETAKNSAYDATIGKAVGFMKNMGEGITDSKVVRTARNNPIPLVLIGVGAGWLAYSSLSGNSRRRSPSAAGFRPDRINDEPRSIGQNSSTLSDLSNKASHLTDKVSNAANSAYDSVSNTMDSAVSNAKDVANRAYSKAGEYGNAAYETYDHYLTENPLAVGAAAFALGAVVGLAIPSTRYEGDLMGEARDQLLQKAQDKGSMLLDKTRGLVDDATNAVSRETRSIIH